MERQGVARRHRFFSFYLKQVSGLLAVVSYHHIASRLTLHRPVDYPSMIDITQPRRVCRHVYVLTRSS